ncbi:MAG: hypothetical protein ACRDR6_29810 [Pseudonocardiaceae bacterium]
MLGFLAGLLRTRAVRPLLVWVLAVLGFVAFGLPQEWVLLLIVGLGVALTVTVRRVREAAGQAIGSAGPGWQLVERLAGAIEDRIRDDHDDDYVPRYGPQAAYYGQVPPGQPGYGQVGGPAVAYDPGALLSGVVAVLAAEGLPTNAAPALPAAVALLADLGVQAHPGVPAPTARGLVTTLTVGPPRRARVLPPALVASVIRVILTHDEVLPAQITTDTADILTTHTARMLMRLGIQPGDAGSLADWPVIGQIIDAVPLPVPYEQWNR